MGKGDFGDMDRARQKKADEFINGATADGLPQDERDPSAPDPDAPRKYKQLRLAFNQHEYDLLSRAASKERLGLVPYIRQAWYKKAEKELE